MVGVMEISWMQVVREKLFKRLYKELPYRLDIKDAGLSLFRDGSIRIEKHVLVRSSQVKTVNIAALRLIYSSGSPATSNMQTTMRKMFLA